MDNLLCILKWGNCQIWANHDFFKLRMADPTWFLDHMATNTTSEHHKSSKQGVCATPASGEAVLSAPSPPLHSRDKRVLRAHNMFATAWYWICLKSPNRYGISTLPGLAQQGWPRHDP